METKTGRLAKTVAIATTLLALAGSGIYLGVSSHLEAQRRLNLTNQFKPVVVMPGDTIDSYAINVRNNDPNYAGIDYRTIRRMIKKANGLESDVILSGKSLNLPEGYNPNH